MNENGTWQNKTEKEYLCVKDGEERGFTAAEFKEAQKDGWEKQFQYKVGKKKEYIAPSLAKAKGLERTHVQVPQEYEIRQAESDLRALEQRRSVGGLVRGMGS